MTATSKQDFAGILQMEERFSNWKKIPTNQRIYYITLSGCTNPSKTAYNFCPP